MTVKERVNYVEPNGRKFSKTATAVDAATAAAFMETISIITVGTIQSATVTTEVDPADYPDTGVGTYSDATFHFRKGTENANVHFEQLANNYAEVIDGNRTGNVLITDGAIVNFAAAWSTAHGGGWSLVEGHYGR